ncbi:MAG TPA: hypothetical protein VK066_07100 [Chloroflexota bacterium]|nr:hypothetical protein [Chloroflexota bacterium]
MEPGALLGAAGAWCGFAVAAIANGTVRETVLRPAVGRAAEPLSVATLSGLIFAGTRLYVQRLARRASEPQLWAVGIGWAAATVAFEFLFGRYVARASWQALLANYDVRRGRLWPLVLLTLLVGPPLLGRRRRSATRRRSRTSTAFPYSLAP